LDNTTQQLRFYALVNSLLLHFGQGGILSCWSKVTFVLQLVQLKTPLPGFSPVFTMFFIIVHPPYLVNNSVKHTNKNYTIKLSTNYDNKMA
jgi:hypothetical protein